jgi:hypothetical protein
MLRLSLLLLLLLPQPGQNPQPEPPATEPEAPTVAYDEGPLRVEFVAMREVRMRAAEPELAGRMQSDLRIQVRIAGEPLKQVAQYGNVILTEMVDDQGKSLINDDTYTDEEREIMRPLNIPVTRLAQDGLKLVTQTDPASRGAAKLTKMRGTVRLVLADKTEQITIDNPFQYLGGKIADPRLEELGIEIAVVSAADVENAPPANRCIVLNYVNKGEHVQGATFFDGWMRPLNVRNATVNLTDGTPVQLYYFDAGKLTDETQMVLEVHPKVEQVDVPVNLDGLELP